MEKIEFYSTKGKHGCFSNFSHHPVNVFGKEWQTSEHAYQAQKFHETSTDYFNVLFAQSPREAANIGRDRKRPLRKDWEEVKDGIMYEVVFAKFNNNSQLKQILLNTKDAVLIEHTVNDSYWGDGGNGTGKNMLGKILMKVREEIKNKGK